MGRPTASAIAALLALSGCVTGGLKPDASVTASPQPCVETPTTEYQVAGYVVLGKGSGDVFFYMYPDGKERVIRSGQPEKFLVFLRTLPADPPVHVAVLRREIGSARTTTFETVRHASAFGTEWGTNFEFPTPGCWVLEVNEAGNRGSVVLRVD